MGLGIDDVEKVWALVDNGDNRLNAEELTDGVAKLMGEAKSIDLLSLIHDFSEFKRVLFRSSGHDGNNDFERNYSAATSGSGGLVNMNSRYTEPVEDDNIMQI